MFDSSVPVLVHFLKGLSTILAKAEAHCEARKIDPNALLTARLFPDMFHFTRQVQLVTDFAKGIGARLAGVAVPSFADTETTFAELQVRIARTIEFLGTLKKEQFEGAADRLVALRAGGQELSFKGAEYFATYGLPNFYFHLSTAYNILRHNGLDLGKRDFLGRS
jgi:hypothetical protein